MTNRYKKDATWSRRDWAVSVKIEVVFWVWKVGKPWQRMGGRMGSAAWEAPAHRGGVLEEKKEVWGMGPR